MMTRKHFERTAKILNEQLSDCRVQVEGVAIPGLVYPGRQGEYDAILFLASEFADWFSEENSSFDRERFFRAVLA
jgi:hypothetical protein